MKILFTITVVIAAIYLFIQQNGLDKIKQFLPQHKIEQAAETLLTDVDHKLEQFKANVLDEKTHRINELEKQLASLQAQFKEKEIKEEEEVNTDSSTNSIDNNDVMPTFPAQQQYAKKQNIQEQQVTAEQINIKRQANLQDIAERMNRTSLLALTN